MRPDRIRRGTAYVIVIVMAVALASAPTMAQVTASGIETAATVANADTVDGKHAVGFTRDTAARAGKIVATNWRGYLPGNIILRARNTARLDGLRASAFAKSWTGVFSDSVKVTFRKGTPTSAPGRRATAACPDYAVAVGGGFYVSSLDEADVFESRPAADDSWTVFSRAAESGSDYQIVKAWVLCIADTGG